MERLNTRIESKNLLMQEAEKEKGIVIELNRFNAYTIHDISDIDYIEELYLALETSIAELVDKEKVVKYMDYLVEIKGYKDILLAPYVAEREAQLEAERLEIEENLKMSLDFMRELTEYYDGIESIFNNFEIQLEYAEEKEVDTTVYRAEMEIIRDSLYAMKPVEPEIEDTPIDSEGTENTEGEDTNSEDTNSDSENINSENNTNSDSESSENGESSSEESETPNLNEFDR